MLVNIDKIKMICKEKGIKQSYLCESLGLHFSYLNDVKKGSSPMTKERLRKIAEILDVNIEYLNDETEDRTSYNKKEENPVSELSKDDEMILELFRSLREEQKDSLLKLMRSMVERQNDE